MIWQNVKDLEMRLNGLIAAVDAMRGLIATFAKSPIDDQAAVIKAVDDRLSRALMDARPE